MPALPQTIRSPVPARSLRRQMVLLIGALVIPLIILSIVITTRLADAESRLNRRENFSTVRAISLAIDQQILSAESALFALASSPELQRADWSAFYSHCLQVAKLHDAHILLAEASGREIVNTLFPEGAPLADPALTAAARRAMESLAPQITNLFIGARGRPLVSIIIPVMEGRSARYALGMSFGPDALNAILAKQNPPPDWTVTIADGNGVLIGRSRTPELFVGQPVTGDLRAAMAKTKEGYAVLHTREGTEVYGSFTRSALSGWTTVIGIPRVTVEAPLRQSLVEIGFGGLVMVVLSMSTAFIAARRLDGDIETVRRAAIALGDAAPIPRASSTMKELNDIMAALDAAALALRKRAQERDEAEAALRASELRLGRAHRIAALGSWELDPALGTFCVSPEMCAILGWPEDRAKATLDILSQLIDEGDRLHFRSWLHELSRGTRPAGCEFRLRREGGDVRFIACEAEPVVEGGQITRIQGTSQDITAMRRAQQQRQELERQLNHSQKLEALGTLAGGIAHDLNNALVPVLALSKLELLRAADEARAPDNLTTIYHGAQRARELVRQVLAFSRKDLYRREAFQPAPVLREALAMLRASLPPLIAIETAIEDTPAILGDPTQLHQVMANLLANAAYAIGERGGTITVALSEVASGPLPRSLLLSVADTGHGMDDETLQRLFDPFFTTKPVGEGTGLGLSVAHGIVANHGGEIRVASRPGEGSRFDIYLPVADAREEGILAPAEEERRRAISG